MVINIISGVLIAIVLKYLNKTLHRRETILTELSVDLARVLFAFITSACCSIIYREFYGPLKKEYVILFFAAIIQEVHLLLHIIALCLQITTFLFFFFGQKIISWNKSQFQWAYRTFSITISIAGTVYYCQKKTGLFAKIPLYFYFLDDTADGRKLVLRNYSYFLSIFMILVSGMQIAIEWKKRKLKQKDQVAKSRANEASQRLSLARIMTKLTAQKNSEKIRNSNAFSSMPSLLMIDNDVFIKPKQITFQKDIPWYSKNLTSTLTPKHRTQTIAKAKMFASKVSPYPLNSKVQYSGKTIILMKKANSCPNLQSLLLQSVDIKPISQNVAKAFTRAISIFIVFPTLFLVGNVIFGGFKLAKPHSNTITILSVYGIVTPLAYILGKPKLRKVLVDTVSLLNIQNLRKFIVRGNSNNT